MNRRNLVLLLGVLFLSGAGWVYAGPGISGGNPQFELFINNLANNYIFKSEYPSLVSYENGVDSYDYGKNDYQINIQKVAYNAEICSIDKSLKRICTISSTSDKSNGEIIGHIVFDNKASYKVILKNKGIDNETFNNVYQVFGKSFIQGTQEENGKRD